MAALEESLVGKALWLHAGASIIPMSLENSQVWVDQGFWHGHYATYRNFALHDKCLHLCFSGYQNRGGRFEEQVPHHLKPLGKHVYRNHNQQQVLVFGNVDYPVTVGLPCSSISCAYPDVHCQHEFVYCHPSKSEVCLRLGWHELLPKVSFNGREPTGKWSLHEFPSCHGAPAGIDRSRAVLTVTFHCKGESSKEITTVYGVVAGTTDVYRAIGCTDSTGMTRIYVDDELSLLSKWHIVLVGVR